MLMLGLLAPGARAQKPTPDLAEVKYGPRERNVLDLWQANSATPTPLVVYIHGGGFSNGSKERISEALIKRCLKAGISVMSINYRLSPEVQFPAHYMDCARAIQFARAHAKEWNIDPQRLAATGSSAGAGTALWIGFHDDFADPRNSDPVLRESTRLVCMAVTAAQCTYDPRTIREWIGGPAASHQALQRFYGLKADEVNTPKAYQLYEAAAPINLVTADDPPVLLFYSEANEPVPPDAKRGTGIHHPIFGRKLKEKMDSLNIECATKHQSDYSKTGGSLHDDMLKFFVKYLKPTPGPKPSQ